eukprot:g46985.t1
MREEMPTTKSAGNWKILYLRVFIVSSDDECQRGCGMGGRACEPLTDSIWSRLPYDHGSLLSRRATSSNKALPHLDPPQPEFPALRT